MISSRKAECTGSSGNRKGTERFHEAVTRVARELLPASDLQGPLGRVPVGLPSRETVAEIVDRARRILFPGYLKGVHLDRAQVRGYVHRELSHLSRQISGQIALSLHHQCTGFDDPCPRCARRAREMTVHFIKEFPRLKRVLMRDVAAAWEGDPAAKSYTEIITCYPGIFAISVYRMAHHLLDLGVPLLPRMMTEYAHGLTGIDLHPGSEIGESFFIDHGTGVVVGETTRIGKRVRVYQGVTLGALSLPRKARSRLLRRKRHPTIEDEVVIYSNATILGGETVIGARSVIGGNVWITESVVPDTQVLLKGPELILTTDHHGGRSEGGARDQG